jgi:DNA replication protein DnaC
MKFAQSLATLDWISRAENLVVAGPPGTRKSRLVEIPAKAAIEKDVRVASHTQGDPQHCD